MVSIRKDFGRTIKCSMNRARYTWHILRTQRVKVSRQQGYFRCNVPSQPDKLRNRNLGEFTFKHSMNDGHAAQEIHDRNDRQTARLESPEKWQRL